MRIFVGNVAFTTSEFDLEELFGRYGRVDRVQIATDRESGRSRGFAFVEMPDSAEAHAAMEALHGSSLLGRALTVNEARPREGDTRPRRPRAEQRPGTRRAHTAGSRLAHHARGALGARAPL